MCVGVGGIEPPVSSSRTKHDTDSLHPELNTDLFYNVACDNICPMNKEYDLVNELGPRNWLDVTAGEAVVLGMATGDPEMTVLGTELSRKVQEVRFDDDRFGRVEALAKDVEVKIREKMDRYKGSVFIDNLFCGTEKNKSAYEWEYSFVYVEGQYQIKMYLPIYYDQSELMDATRLKAQEVFDSMSRDALPEREEAETRYEHQVFKEVVFLDGKDNIVRKIVDFNHEDGSLKRGCLEHFYFDDFSTALSVWQKIRSTFISNQKR